MKHEEQLASNWYIVYIQVIVAIIITVKYWRH